MIWSTFWIFWASVFFLVNWDNTCEGDLFGESVGAQGFLSNSYFSWPLRREIGLYSMSFPTWPELNYSAGLFPACWAHYSLRPWTLELGHCIGKPCSWVWSLTNSWGCLASGWRGHLPAMCTGKQNQHVCRVTGGKQTGSMKQGWEAQVNELSNPSQGTILQLSYLNTCLT